jgi:hypothetical protein
MRILLLLLLACGRAVSPERSEVSCGPCEARADGHERIRVGVVVRDGAGRPVRGAFVLLGPARTESDGEGRAFADFTSRTVGEAAIDVRIADGPALGSVAVQFGAGSFPRVQLGAP